MLPTLAELESLTGRLKALEAQLASLETPEVERLQATDRRERALIAHHDELAERLARLPAPRRPRRDAQAVERQGLEQAIAGAQRELAALRAVRARLEREVGPLAEVLAERAGLRQAIAKVQDERQHVRDRLIESAVAESPAWARGLLGERPTKASARRVYDHALAAVAGYRLDHAITGPEPLGSPPDDPLARRDYQRTVTRVERAQQRLGLIGGPYTPSPGVPHRYRVALGELRTRAIEALLDEASQRASGLTADGLEQAIAVGRAALKALDARAAARALRLENQLDEHRQRADQETTRARELAEQAKTLGWRQRSDRQRLLEAAAELRDQVDHHQADLERIELELARLRATDRHPDQWLARHAQTVADGLAAEVEHEQRRQADIDRQAARAALDPPPHVRDLLGERPTSGPTVTQAWQRLAVALERHRLQYRIDVAKDGPLGPSPADPTVRASVAYRRDRERLAREITRLRHQRGLEPHPEIPQFAPRRSPGRGPDPGR